MKKIDITKKYTTRIGEEVQGLQWSPDGEQLAGWVKDKDSGIWESLEWDEYGRYFGDEETANDLIELETEQDKWFAIREEWLNTTDVFFLWLKDNFKAPERLGDCDSKESTNLDLDSAEFYNLMQQYRFASEEDQADTIKCFNEVKEWILKSIDKK